MSFIPQQLTLEDWNYLYQTSDPAILLNQNLLSFNGIQDTLCVGNSLETFKSTFFSLTSGIGIDSPTATNESLLKYAYIWNDLYSRFIEVSASIMQATLIVEEHGLEWISASATTTAMSSFWTTPFSVIYPAIQTTDPENTTEWNSLTQNVSTWLKQKFPLVNYAPGQRIIVQILYQQSLPFTLSIERKSIVKCRSHFTGYNINCEDGCFDGSYPQFEDMYHYNGGYTHCANGNSGELILKYKNTEFNELNSQPEIKTINNQNKTEFFYNDRRRVFTKTLTRVKTLQFVKQTDNSLLWTLVT